ncbi:hypothetical protein CEP54_013028 [Fusarium duplospermum]|uniref:Aminoglycoside phosphotransferase domain-containing protein n=1 Tax=Fusarium duplospermum TaxID=1325734 RepID=A0A428P5F8_9HYPO|nr:hypothetical protein CEP54_013028 [Fusarium duplospermum]
MATKEPITSNTKAPATRVRKAKSGASRPGRWNREMLNRLTVALKEDPEADMITLLTPMYSKKLRSLKQASSLPSDDHAARLAPLNRDIRAQIHATDPSSVIFKPSAELEALLHEDLGLSEGIVNLLADSEVLYTAASITVFKLNEALVVKITSETALTEHRSLAFLQENLPSFPAPRPHGLIRLGHFYLLFTTFIPGLDLDKVWPRLNRNQKQNITDQLGVLFSQLRSLPYLAPTPLGDVQGGDGCRDLRRDLRISTEPITTDKEFQDFIFSGSRTASASYIRLLRGLMPESAAKIVFTHGDLRPPNIIVQEGEDGQWQVVSVIDWELSGFYPEYWECIKATNNLTPRDSTDWYQYLPDLISPGRYPTHWLIDRLWDRSMVNS